MIVNKIQRVYTQDDLAATFVSKDDEWVNADDTWYGIASEGITLSLKNALLQHLSARANGFKRVINSVNVIVQSISKKVKSFTISISSLAGILQSLSAGLIISSGYWY